MIINIHPIIKMDTSGEGIWLSLKALAKLHHNNPKEFERNARAIFADMPCNICVKDAFDYLERNPISNPVEWLCKFHNYINVKIGKPVYRCPKFPMHKPGEPNFKQSE